MKRFFTILIEVCHRIFGSFLMSASEKRLPHCSRPRTRGEKKAQTEKTLDKI